LPPLRAGLATTAMMRRSATGCCYAGARSSSPGEKALGLAELRRIGSDAAGLRAEAVFVVGAQGAPPAKTAENGRFGLWCRSKPSKAKALRNDRGTRRSKSMVPLAAPLTSVQTTTISETGPTECRFPLSCPPPFLPFLPFRPGMQPGAPRLTAHRNQARRERGNADAHGVLPPFARATNMLPSAAPHRRSRTGTVARPSRAVAGLRTIGLHALRAPDACRGRMSAARRIAVPRANRAAARRLLGRFDAAAVRR
jgi:hypothetical protein